MVEGGRFEIYCARSRTGGSNPPLSAPLCITEPKFARPKAAKALDPFEPFVRGSGEVTEWLKVHDWNSCVGQLTGGSNPPLSATPPFVITGSVVPWFVRRRLGYDDDGRARTSTLGGEGRGPATVAREPRQVRKEATVASVSGRWLPRLSPRGWMFLVALLVTMVAACAPKTPPRPMGAPAPLPCPDGTHEQLQGLFEQWCATDDGTRHGVWQRWHSSGVRAEYVLYDAGRREGAYWLWGDDGELELEGGYSGGLKTGFWVWWYGPDRPKLRGHFISGFENGRWQAWFPTGQLQSDGAYAHGDRVGPWRYVHATGFDAAVGTYTSLGELADDWTCFDLSGEPLSVDSFRALFPAYGL